MSKIESYKILIRQFYKGCLKDVPKSTFEEYLEDPDFLEAWEELLEKSVEDSSISAQSTDEALFEKIKADNRIIEEITSIPVTKQSNFKRISTLIAAAIVLCVGAFSFMYWLGQHPFSIEGHRVDEEVVSHEYIRPGGQNAQIILENGEVIDLSKINGDTVIDNGAFEIVKKNDGTISYRLKDIAKAQMHIAYHTILTPKGGEYNLILPDGTKVWLNAMTKLRYPVVFDKSKREIELEGEAYFEVNTKVENGKRIPFIIHTGGQELEVLGTVFNVQKYDNTVVTTLVEGKVKLSFANSNLSDEYLLPNEQVNFVNETGKLSKKNVDPYYFTAWKDGKFAFKKTPINEVMAMISRWYDVDIIYGAEHEDFQFSGSVSRYEDLRKLLTTIELVGGIHFEIKGREVYVKK